MARYFVHVQLKIPSSEEDCQDAAAAMREKMQSLGLWEFVKSMTTEEVE